MRKILKKPIAEVVMFSVQDIITTSETPDQGYTPDNGGLVTPPDEDGFQ